MAMTMNGRTSLCVSPSRVTCRSCIDSNSAAWVLGGARLISSASRMFVNSGPFRRTKEDDPRSRMNEPVMSAGSRSGVNWTL